MSFTHIIARQGHWKLHVTAQSKKNKNMGTSVKVTGVLARLKMPHRLKGGRIEKIGSCQIFCLQFGSFE